MPQYKLKQYGLKQYGIYQTDDGTTHPFLSHFKFQRARMYAKMKNGQLFWVYQHRPVQIKSMRQTLRISTNTGDMVKLAHININGYKPVRVRSNLNLNIDGLLYSQTITQKGGPK